MEENSYTKLFAEFWKLVLSTQLSLGTPKMSGCFYLFRRGNRTWRLPCDLEDETTCPDVGRVVLLRVDPGETWDSEDLAFQQDELKVPPSFRVNNMTTLAGAVQSRNRFGGLGDYPSFQVSAGRSPVLLSVAFVAPDASCSMTVTY